MTDAYKGKLFFLFNISLLISFAGRTFADSNNDAASLQHELPQPSFDAEHTGHSSVGTIPQEVLLSRLEELVKNLTEIVSRLEPILLETGRKVSFDEKSDSGNERRRTTKSGAVLENKIKTGEIENSDSVAKQNLFWSDRFHLVSAVKVNSKATCINVLPFRDFEGLSKYVAVGDDRGRIYLFLRNGKFVADFYTECESPITAIVSYLSSNKNESFVVTGHKNGAIMMHKVCDKSVEDDFVSVSMGNVGKFFVPTDEDDGFSVNVLEVHHVGRSRYILSSDTSGKLKAFKENGTFHGSAIPKSKPLAFLKQKLLFLTESGAGSLDLRTMKIREAECEGLNHSLSRSYVFDAIERSKAYGYTCDGDLIHVLLLGDIMNFKCRVRSKRKLDMGNPVVLQAIKGYLLVANKEKVFVFNVSSHHYVRVGGPRHLYTVELDEIRFSFLESSDNLKEDKLIPLLASDRDKFFVLSFESGYVVTFVSNLPVFKGELNTMLWTSPVLFFLIFLFGAWQFFAKKKEALTAWGPDDSFTTSPTVAGAPASHERPFMEGSTSSMELRGGSRRFGSPPGFSGVSPAGRDQGFRASSELKYRGEAAAFPKRSE